MKTKSTLLKIRKIENFQHLNNHWRKKIHAKIIIFFKKFKESLKKSFRQIREKNGIGS